MRRMEHSDDELILQYRAGNQSAFDELVKRYLHPIFVFSRRMTGSDATAEDVTQETFVKVWKMLGRYHTTNTFKSWLFAIARNTAIDYLRKKKLPVVSSFDTSEGKNLLAETISDPDTLPDNLIEKAENKKLVESALEVIPIADREILILHYSDGLTFDAIGKIVKKPLNTVKSRHRRAMAKLREYIEKSP